MVLLMGYQLLCQMFNLKVVLNAPVVLEYDPVGHAAQTEDKSAPVEAVRKKNTVRTRLTLPYLNRLIKKRH